MKSTRCWAAWSARWVPNIDFRLRQTDASFDAALSGAPWLGMPIAELDNLDRVLVVGSFLRKDHPLMAQRLRQAAKRGTQILLVDSAADDPLMPVAGRITVAPSELARALAEVAVALAQAKEQAVPAEFASVTPGEQAKIIAASLASGSNTAVLMGNLAVASAQASTLAANGQAVAALAGGKFGFLTSGGNTVGGYLAGAVPGQGGKNAAAMLAEPLKAYVVLHAEPLLDADNGGQAVAALRGAQFAVALTPYRSAAADWADVMLPVSPFTETSGTYVNARACRKASRVRLRRSARPVRAGRSCECWATSCIWPASTTRPPSPCATPCWPAAWKIACPTPSRPSRAWARSWAAWSAWPTCRSIAATPWCAVPSRCRPRRPRSSPPRA